MAQIKKCTNEHQYIKKYIYHKTSNTSRVSNRSRVSNTSRGQKWNVL